jgi:pimeloyl-ACP methyl ester carboxylesterase
MPTGIISQHDHGNYARVNGLRMYYEIHGKGSPLVLIHGGGSSIHTSFGNILHELAKERLVIGVELQGHGHTADRAGAASFEQDADDVAELLTQLGVSGADLFGFSNGGNTALQVALRHPGVVRKIIVASSFYKSSGMYSWFWKAMEKTCLENLPSVYKQEFLRINPNPEALRNMHDKDAARMKTFTDWPEALLRAIANPVLVVIGDQDIVTTEHAVAMYRAFPSARLAILPGNHGSYMGEAMSRDQDSKIPLLFTALVEEFLAAPMPE